MATAIRVGGQSRQAGRRGFTSANDDPREEPNEALGRWKALRQGAKSDYRKILNERENELLEANTRFGPKSLRFQNARADLEEAELQRHEIRDVLRRPLARIHFRSRYLLIFALVLAVLEGLVNKFLFDVALGSIGFVSYVTSIVIAFGVVLLAHLAGRCLRQVWSEYRKRIVWSNVLAFLAIATVLTTIVCILTVGRAMTSANAGIDSFQDMFGAITTSVTSVGLWRTLGQSFANINALILATVNITGIFAAMMLAVFTHDPDKDFDAAATKVERHRRELDKLDTLHIDARTKVIGRFASHLGAVGARFKAANSEVMQLKHRLGEPEEPDDTLLIDEWDILAETSKFGEGAGDTASEAGERDAPHQRGPHLQPVEPTAGMKRA